MAQKRLAILGSTGSIGTQTLEVVDAHPDLYTVEILSGHNNTDLLIAQAIKYQPNAVIVTNEDKYDTVKSALSSLPVKVFSGHNALNETVQWDSVDVVVGAIVGFAGLHSIIAALDAGKHVALANKETLVVAGEIVMQKAKEKGNLLTPVDSEHSAIFQCLAGEPSQAIEKLILTASGGPFLGKKPNFLVNVKKEHALQHPNWNMGAKITIDSATLMNKGLEMIEAKWLFGVRNEQIEVVVHPQSIVHSMVQFTDGAIKAQLGLPDMRLPIQYALSFPDRIHSDFKRLEIKDYAQLTFEQPDYKTFKNLTLAKEAMFRGGNATCTLNAANEEVVYAFLKNKVGFLEMGDIIEATLENVHYMEHPTLAELEETDRESRLFAQKQIKKSQLNFY